MAFKIGQIRTPKPSTALDVLLNAEGRKIGSAYDHQGDIIRKYHAEAQEAPDVAFELPTGSGKTLVGVLIAEWRRLNHEARVVYLCPNKQLAYQVADQARTQYGLQVVPLVGIQANFDQGDSSSYRRGEACAVTTYSGLFNAGHYFDDVNTIVLDDAHAAESYIADHWSLHIRADDEPAMFEKMAELIAPLLGDADASRMLAEWESRDGASWSQKIASSELANIADQIRSLLDVHTAASDLVWPWRVVRDHLHACHLYVGAKELLLRPIIPPTWTLPAFSNASQRIYLSATLGTGGELERTTGRPNIKRLSLPDSWKQRGIGRRFFIFPEMSLSKTESDLVKSKMMAEAGRSLVLVPSDPSSVRFRADVASLSGIPCLGVREIERTKAPFLAMQKAAVVAANRYDGKVTVALCDVPGIKPLFMRRVIRWLALFGLAAVLYGFGNAASKVACLLFWGGSRSARLLAAALAHCPTRLDQVFVIAAAPI